MPMDQLDLTRPKLSASIATKQGTLLENADQKEIKKAKGEMQGTLDIKQKTIGGDLENRRNLKLCTETLESMPEPVVVEPKVVSQPKVWSDAPIIEEYESDNDDEYETVKEQNTYSPSPKADKRDWNGLMSKRCVTRRTSFNLENIVPLEGLACLIAKATVDESNKWHRREYSNARTLQQNGVAKRKNMTLIEAARTMLADSFLPNTFMAEAVSTACYVLNRILPAKSENQANKTTGPEETNHTADTQDNIDAGNSKMEADPAQDYFVLLIYSSYTSTVNRSLRLLRVIDNLYEYK
ncbi:retrovirus-related pol polyprotein from transposon TNT 1-94 [Tanacetum coccineum]